MVQELSSLLHLPHCWAADRPVNRMAAVARENFMMVSGRSDEIVTLNIGEPESWK